MATLLRKCKQVTVHGDCDSHRHHHDLFPVRNVDQASERDVDDVCVHFCACFVVVVSRACSQRN